MKFQNKLLGFLRSVGFHHSYLVKVKAPTRDGKQVLISLAGLFRVNALSKRRIATYCLQMAERLQPVQNLPDCCCRATFRLTVLTVHRDLLPYTPTEGQVQIASRLLVGHLCSLVLLCTL